MLDLNQPPYARYREALDRLRRDPQTWPEFGYQAAHTPERAHHDAQESERERIAHMLLLFGVTSDAGLIRFLLDSEIQARRADSFQGAGDTLCILSLLLVELGDGDSADLLRFWAAKRANFDTFAGGYDIAFLFCQQPPEQVLALLQAQAPDALEALKRYDPEEIVEGLPRWRRSLSRRYPRQQAQLIPDYAESWAETFGDRAAELHFGLQRAQTPADRARLYARVDQHGDAHLAWREAAEQADTPWDQASALHSAMVSAALAGHETVEEAQILDRLRHEIPNWAGLGIGRMSTQACFALAAAAQSPEPGRTLWRTARSWQADLESFTLVGLRDALKAAALWGSPEDIQALQQAHDAEHARIYGAAD